MSNPTPPEIRAAKRFLARRKITSSEISPRMFARASKELDQSFKQTFSQLIEEEGSDGTTPDPEE